jgi:heptosyltransferase-2
MWIGDFVRCHSIVKLLQQHAPERPIDVLTTTLCAPFSTTCRACAAASSAIPAQAIGAVRTYCPGATVARGQLRQRLIMPRTWKAALAPYSPES